MYLSAISGVIVLSQPDKICCVSGCDRVGVIPVGTVKQYCANCYTFVFSRLLTRGKGHGYSKRVAT